jgi:DNA-binding NtrC family response regulator
MTSTTLERPKESQASTNEFKLVTGGLPAVSRERATVMLLGGDQPALRSLYGTLHSRAKVVLAEDLPSALEKLSRQEINAVFCAACFHCGSWVEALQTIGFLHPHIPVIVVNEASQDRTFTERQADIYAAGGFDVLPDPHDESSVMVVLTHALASGEARGWQAAS